jgi:hypothetical protein
MFEGNGNLWAADKPADWSPKNIGKLKQNMVHTIKFEINCKQGNILVTVDGTVIGHAALNNSDLKREKYYLTIGSSRAKSVTKLIETEQNDAE